MWHLIFLYSTIFNILSLIYPFLVKIEVKMNVLKLKGSIILKLFNKLKLEFKFRIKNGYIYVYFKRKELKEKLSSKNVNVRFVLLLIKQFYFRQQLLNLKVKANFGYRLNAMTTAVNSGLIDVLCKGFLSKIKNNKKSAHIFTDIKPKYDEDIFNFAVSYEIRMSLVDIIYSLIYTKFSMRGEYEKNGKSRFKSKQKNRVIN